MDVSEGVSQDMEIYGCISITPQGLQPILLQDDDEVGGDVGGAGVDDAGGDDAGVDNAGVDDAGGDE